ncbi:hypothetical protein D1831_08275 [Lactiplantibacillus garii]|uniref:Uncharacterized protein n=1 Tax=Lactiplantibacillus garii TaxID=2306423 RepID=A0A426D6R6_9LACO|nr:hypothetical protein [Lactiplantibacillus garii]RRK10304.1 hypothetical protein D1831_08275 [Lactiplantibacillus garii]
MRPITTLENYLAFFNTPLLSAGQTIGELVVRIQTDYAQRATDEHLSIYYDAVADNIVIDWNDQHQVIKRFTNEHFNRIEAAYQAMQAQEVVEA